jgi:hypothetical protein
MKNRRWLVVSVALALAGIMAFAQLGWAQCRGYGPRGQAYQTAQTWMGGGRVTPIAPIIMRAPAITPRTAAIMPGTAGIPAGGAAIIAPTIQPRKPPQTQLPLLLKLPNNLMLSRRTRKQAGRRSLSAFFGKQSFMDFCPPNYEMPRSPSPQPSPPLG